MPRKDSEAIASTRRTRTRKKPEAWKSSLSALKERRQQWDEQRKNRPATVAEGQEGEEEEEEDKEEEPRANGRNKNRGESASRSRPSRSYQGGRAASKFIYERNSYRQERIDELEYGMSSDDDFIADDDEEVEEEASDKDEEGDDGFVPAPSDESEQELVANNRPLRQRKKLMSDDEENEGKPKRKLAVDSDDSADELVASSQRIKKRSRVLVDDDESDAELIMDGTTEVNKKDSILPTTIADSTMSLPSENSTSWIAFTESKLSESERSAPRLTRRKQSLIVDSDSEEMQPIKKMPPAKDATPPDSCEPAPEENPQLVTPRKLRRRGEPIPSPLSQVKEENIIKDASSPSRRSRRIQNTETVKLAHHSQVLNLLDRSQEEDEDDEDEENELYLRDDDLQDESDLDGFIVSDKESDVDEDAVFDCVCGAKEENVSHFTGKKFQCSKIECGRWCHSRCFKSASRKKFVCHICRPIKDVLEPDSISSLLFTSLSNHDEPTSLSLLTQSAFPTVIRHRYIRARQRTALHIACEAGAPLVVQKLMDAGADLEATDLDGVTPFHVAATFSMECCRVLVDFVLNGKRGRKKRKEGVEDEQVRALKKVLVKTDQAGHSPLSFAAEYATCGDERVMTKRKKRGRKMVKVVVEPFNLFKVAAETCGLRLKDVLTGKCENLVHVACRAGNVWVMNELKRCFGDFEEAVREKTAGRGATPIHYAAAGTFTNRTPSSLSCLRLLVDHFRALNTVQVDVDVRDNKFADNEGFRSPLLYALGSGVPWGVDGEEGGLRGVLEDRGSCKDEGHNVEVEGKAAEDTAEGGSGEEVQKEGIGNVEGGIGSADDEMKKVNESSVKEHEDEEGVVLEAVCLLLDCGLSRYTTDVHGSTLLHLAAADGLSRIVRHLLDLGLAPDVQDLHGWTPLLYAHVATEVGNVEDDCLVALLERKPQQLYGLFLRSVGGDKRREKVVRALVTSLGTKPMTYKLLNDIIRHNPALILTHFAWVRDIPGLLDFDNKRTVFIRECQSLRRPHLSISVTRGKEMLTSYPSVSRYVEQHLHRLRPTVASKGVSLWDLGWGDDDDEDDDNDFEYSDEEPGFGGWMGSGIVGAIFEEEMGIGPGVTREFWSCFGEDMVDVRHGVFGEGVEGDGARDKEEGMGGHGTVFFADDETPCRNGWWEIEILCGRDPRIEMAKHVGRVFGLAVLDGQVVPGASQLCAAVFKVLSSGDHGRKEKFGLDDLVGVDPVFHRHLTWLLENCIGKDGGELGMTFAIDVVEEGKVVSRALINEGEEVAVTDINKKRFVELAVEERFGRCKKKREAFLKGFWEVVPKKYHSYFSPTELEILIAGETTVSIDAWKATTTYESTYQSWMGGATKHLASLSQPFRRVAEWFWSVLEEDMSVNERLALLSARQLKLPVYSSRDQLREKLLLAVRHGSLGFQFL
ncbi:hypothetical protein HDU67_005459 [Dinochytrium kinnereticum]|nr:hypothetical protein HDU67_005459 [Dinochytrium kinnereticum]